MGKISKTRVPYTGSLPAGGSTTTLFDSTVAFGPKAMHMMAEHNWIDLSLFVDQNATGNSLIAQYSNDGGVTWRTFFTSAANSPVGGTLFSVEIFIGQFQDVRVRFVNGTNAQNNFEVNLCLDAKQRGTANHASPNLDT